MTTNDDFDSFPEEDEFEPEAIEPDEDDLDEGEDDDDDADLRAAEQLVEEVKRRKGNRAQRRSAAKVPASAPKPQDRLPKKSATQGEAEGTDLLLTLFDEELRIDRNALTTSWDWQIGAIEKNPLQMVKGLLGKQQFLWFCMRSEAEGMDPMKAATDLINLFAKASGFKEAGNS